jgi:uncharacterized protein (TIGR00369 family)
MSDHTIVRERRVTWSDPMANARKLHAMSGLDFLRAIARGEIAPPPIAHLMGFTIHEIEDGRVVFAVEPAEYHYNPIGVVHGGLAATLLDSAMGCAVHTKLAPGIGYTTIDLHVTFVRPLTATTGPIRAEGRVLHAGSRVATAEGRVVDARGRIYAHATTRCLIMREVPSNDGE